MSAQPSPHLTIEKYLAYERASLDKHEYFDGALFALAGASEQHNLISVNVLSGLHSQLRQRPCTVYPSDMRVKVERISLYTYPDVTIVCGQTQFEDEHRDTLLNPTVIIEVLSPSTEGYDRGKKFQNYRTIASLVEYMLIAQDAVHVEHYVRQSDRRWLLSEANEVDAVIDLSALGCSLALADIYEKVAFAIE
jgi:Uma2 family endonuclease